jgi:hypothetical protein
VAGDKVWVKVMDKNQRSPNPKLSPPWEKGTILQRGVTGTSYKVERHDRKRKQVKTVNVQQIKPFKKEEEETVIMQPPTPVLHSEQQTPPEEYDSEGEEDYDLPDVDLGPEEEEGEDAGRDTPLPVQVTPLPDGETLLPVGYPPLAETPPPLPETPSQSEGMMTRAQAKGGGGGLRHVPAARTSRQLGHLAKPPPPACESTGRAGQERQGQPPTCKSMGQDQEQQGLARGWGRIDVATRNAPTARQQWGGTRRTDWGEARVQQGGALQTWRRMGRTTAKTNQALEGNDYVWWKYS